MSKNEDLKERIRTLENDIDDLKGNLFIILLIIGIAIVISLIYWFSISAWPQIINWFNGLDDFHRGLTCGVAGSLALLVYLYIIGKLVFNAF